MEICFWQYPCITEQSAAKTGAKALPACVKSALGSTLYIAVPWATWIDLFGFFAFESVLCLQVDFKIRLLSNVVFDHRTDAFLSTKEMRTISVCQHVQWSKAIPWFKQLGLTDVFLSHCPLDESQRSVEGIRLHPWHLFATNVETPERAMGIVRGKPNSEKVLLASFIGAHADHYVSDHRRRLASLKGLPGFHIEIKNEWHFDKQVYEYQLKGKHDFPLVLDEQSVLQYNSVLSDSVFSLCPAGAGANTIRFWESLAVGSIPVVVGPRPALPLIDSGLDCTWDDVVVYFDGDDLQRLPSLLHSFSRDEVDRRQALCMKVYTSIVARTPEQSLALYT